jgi:hypothetical protein
MTEGDWLACSDPYKMLEFLQGKASDRKLRLFAVACCRRIIWPLVKDEDERKRRAVEDIEQVADGLARDLESARRLIAEAGCSSYATGKACRAIYYAAHDDPFLGARMAAAFGAEARAFHLGEDPSTTPATFHGLMHGGRVSVVKKELPLVLRDIFTPFRAVTVEQSWVMWNESAVTKIARAVYEERTFDRLPILADALEDAGCTNEDILTHCRQPGEHVRGCWVVDLLLGKS